MTVDYEQKGQQIGKLVTEKQKSYGDSVDKAFRIFKIFLEDYYDENQKAYIVTEDLLQQMLLKLRVTDKLNRIASNPSFDLMGENPWQDIAGYGLLGSVVKEVEGNAKTQESGSYEKGNRIIGTLTIRI